MLEDEQGLIEVSLHQMGLEELFRQYETSLTGLTSAQAKSKRNRSGDNYIPPPLSAPAWLCCLLPCLLSTPSMEKYNECVPEHTCVKRNGKWIEKMDSASLVPGDIIKVKAGQRVGADIRVIEARDCTFNTSAVHGTSEPVGCDVNVKTIDYTESPNMAFLGYFVETGSCTGVVVATGSQTIMAKLILQKSWPPTEVLPLTHPRSRNNKSSSSW